MQKGIQIEEEKASDGSDSLSFCKPNYVVFNESPEPEMLSKRPSVGVRSSLLELPTQEGGFNIKTNSVLSNHGQSICEEIDLFMQERDENRTFTMVLRSGEKNFEELLNINMDKDLDLI